jgi:hypothetical protein
MTSHPNTKLFTIIDPDSYHKQERLYAQPQKRKLYQLNHPTSEQHDLDFVAKSPIYDEDFGLFTSGQSH